MRYPASEKAEIIRLVEQSHLPAKRTLDKLGIPRATSYRWYDRYPVDLRRWLITVLDRIASGIVSRMMSVARSSTWRWSVLSCRRGSWRCASPTRRSTSSRRRRSPRAQGRLLKATSLPPRHPSPRVALQAAPPHDMGATGIRIEASASRTAGLSFPVM